MIESGTRFYEQPSASRFLTFNQTQTTFSSILIVVTIIGYLQSIIYDEIDEIVTDRSTLENVPVTLHHNRVNSF